MNIEEEPNFTKLTGRNLYDERNVYVLWNNFNVPLFNIIWQRNSHEF